MTCTSLWSVYNLLRVSGYVVYDCNYFRWRPVDIVVGALEDSGIFLGGRESSFHFCPPPQIMLTYSWDCNFLFFGGGGGCILSIEWCLCFNIILYDLQQVKSPPVCLSVRPAVLWCTTLVILTIISLSEPAIFNVGKFHLWKHDFVQTQHDYCAQWQQVKRNILWQKGESWGITHNETFLHFLCIQLKENLYQGKRVSNRHVHQFLHQWKKLAVICMHFKQKDPESNFSLINASCPVLVLAKLFC